jgi:adenylate cyclase
VVGNIGTATRMSYTVVGDTVNAAQRLEGLAKQLLPDAEVAILLSAATAAALPRELATVSLGRHGLRGRDAITEVFELVGDAGRPDGRS